MPLPADMPRLEATGTIDAVAPGMIRMIGLDGQVWMLQISPEAKVRLTGPATSEFLQPGQYVQFLGSVDKRTGQVREKVLKLLVFSPNPENTKTQLGVFPEHMVREMEAAASAAGVSHPGSGPSGEQPFGPPTEDDRANGRQRSRGPGRAVRSPRGSQPPALAEDTPFDIRGRLTGIDRQGVLHVALPPNPYLRGSLQVSLAEEVEITVDFFDPAIYRLATAGDRIEAKGHQVGPNAGFMTELKIEKATPLGQKEERAVTRRPGTGSAAAQPEARRSGPRGPNRDGETNEGRSEERALDHGIGQGSDKPVKTDTAGETDEGEKRQEE